MEAKLKFSDPAKAAYHAGRIAHWDSVALKMRHWQGWGGYYHHRLNEIYGHMIPPGSRVLEIGCGNGDLLASLKPALGVGVDIAPEMTALARELHPGLTFINASADEFSVADRFDFIIFSDILNDVWDVQTIFEHIQQFAAPDVRIILNTYSRLWEPVLRLAERLGLSKPGLGENWLTVSDIDSLLDLSGFEVVRTSREMLFPIHIPLLAPFLNRFLVRFWPFNHFALTNFMVARLQPSAKTMKQNLTVSVVVAARNEAGNIENIFERVPEMGAATEIIFVEGHSTDNTYAAIEEGMTRRPERQCTILRQTGKGKGDAVRLGFSHAAGDILIILDADLTVPPEDLPRFYHALASDKGDFINGVRLVYPMEQEAMRFFNLIGNKFFSLAFSWLLGQSVKDTLCGTKALWREDYERIAANRSIFGDFDPFGDFDLLFGAARLNFKIIDLPTRYRARTYGATNIQRWKHGWLLLRMVLFAAKNIKFI